MDVLSVWRVSTDFIDQFSPCIFCYPLSGIYALFCCFSSCLKSYHYKHEHQHQEIFMAGLMMLRKKKIRVLKKILFVSAPTLKMDCLCISHISVLTKRSTLHKQKIKKYFHNFPLESNILALFIIHVGCKSVRLSVKICMW